MTVEDSYQHCVQVARTRARNFYYSFILLAPAQRRAMCAIYAFMRYCDDLSDDATLADRASAIRRWKTDLDAALEGRYSGHPIWPAFHDSVTRYRIPHQYFYDMIVGVSSDLEPRRIQTFEELYRYCYQVASVVGLTIIHIFGFESPDALPLAEQCGIAFQLTNILRDVREDAGLDRVYLPWEDLVRFDVDLDTLKSGEINSAFVRLMTFEAERARSYYDRALPLIQLVDSKSRASLWALIEIYRRLLARIERENYDVLSRRIRVSSPEKTWIVLKAFAGAAGRATPPKSA